MIKRWLLFAGGFLCLAISAHADQLTVFQVAGTFTNGATVSGNVTIDTITGAITAADLFYSGDGLHYTVVGTQGPYDVGSAVAYTAFIGAGGSPSTLGLAIEGSSALDSLVGYTGGDLCSTNSPCLIPAETGNEYSDWFNSSSTVLLQSGGLVEPPTKAPEPSTTALLALSVISLIGFVVARGRSYRSNPTQPFHSRLWRE